MKTPRALVPIVIGLLLLGGWEWFVRSGRVDDVLVPAPTQIGEWFWSALRDGSLASATWVTMRRLMLGFIILIANRSHQGQDLTGQGCVGIP